MEFEFDGEKSSSNRIKHGIDFGEAQALWDDPDHLLVRARTGSEPRFLVIGRIAGRLWSCVFTYREDRIRIVSVRRSRRREVELYES